LLRKRTTAQKNQGIIDKIEHKLTGWKAKSLSLAGRVTLAQSVLNTIPTFIMQTMVIPVTTCEAIDRCIRNFVWGSTDEARKVHLVSWEHVCTPKEKGGHGLKMARMLNRAYMTKLGFTFFQDSERLWVKVVQSKYFKESEDGFELRHLRSQSPLWKGLSKEQGTMMIGARSAIRNGRETPFWTACWVDSGVRLIDLIEVEAESLDLSKMVCDYVNEQGQWHVEKLMRVLPIDLVSSVIGMSPPRVDSGEDQWVWGGEASGRFSIKSAYNIILSQIDTTRPELWATIWKWRGPNRTRVFLWLVVQEKLLTNRERVRRHMTTTTTCEHCQHPLESVSHVLRDYVSAAEVWNKIGFFDTQDSSWQIDT
ncbi:Putative ribonuclease H protein At1g65750, partial [Linum perenne]